MADTFTELWKEQASEKDRQMAEEIKDFMSGKLGLFLDDPCYMQVCEEIAGDDPDYIRFLQILTSRGSNVDPTVAETMKKRVEKYIKLRETMLSS